MTAKNKSRLHSAKNKGKADRHPRQSAFFIATTSMFLIKKVIKS